MSRKTNNIGEKIRPSQLSSFYNWLSYSGRMILIFSNLNVQVSVCDHEIKV